MQQKLLATMKDMQRYKVLKDVIDKRLKGSEAVHILGLSCVHISRLKKRFLEEGFNGLLRESPATALHRKISHKEIKQILPFLSLYVDKASHFTTTRDGGLHYHISQEQEDAQMGRALHELDIHLITANSPQAKGRIEVTFRLFQDRLIKEIRQAKIKNYQQANTFLLTMSPSRKAFSLANRNVIELLY
jgi:transposase